MSGSPRKAPVAAPPPRGLHTGDLLALAFETARARGVMAAGRAVKSGEAQVWVYRAVRVIVVMVACECGLNPSTRETGSLCLSLFLSEDLQY